MKDCFSGKFNPGSESRLPTVFQLDAITKAVLLFLATREELTGLVERFRKSRSMIQNHKDRLARLIKAYLGEDILRQIQEQPGWHNDMHVTREKLAAGGNDRPSENDEREQPSAGPFFSLSSPLLKFAVRPRLFETVEGRLLFRLLTHTCAVKPPNPSAEKRLAPR